MADRPAQLRIVTDALVQNRILQQKLRGLSNKVATTRPATGEERTLPILLKTMLHQHALQEELLARLRRSYES